MTRGTWSTALAVWTLATACLPETGPPARAGDASVDHDPPTPAIADVEVVDYSGEAYPRDGIPLRPVVVVHTVGELAGDPEPVLLLRGSSDEGLVDDLRAAPLRAATRARALPVGLERQPGRISLRPDAPLEPGAGYVLAVGGWAGGERKLEDPFVADLVAAERGGGARFAGSWPADGSQGVPTTLPLAGLRFDDAVVGLVGGVHLVDRDGRDLGARVERVACESLEWPPGDCAVVRPPEPLWPLREHRLEIDASVVDRGGAPVGPQTIRFRTAPAFDYRGPSLYAPECARDESAVGGDSEGNEAIACALSDDHRLLLRVMATGPERYRLEGPAGTARAMAPRGDARLVLDALAPGTSYALTLAATDLGGTTRRAELTLETTAPLPEMYIVEVRADPRGREPRQEYVELLNAGPDTIDVGGFRLSDSRRAEGDMLPGPTLVGPGERLLVVADGFDPEDADDARPPPGARLVRLDAALASGGISNSGEPLYLRDREGHRLSAAPALPTTVAGTCLVRAAADGRRGDPDAFRADQPCTPGRAAR